MVSTLRSLINRLDDPNLVATNVIPWSSPIPSFGKLSSSRIATLGLNPSNREFVDRKGKELDGSVRRFHTLKSLGLNRWSDASEAHLELIANSCAEYFSRNPYDKWFKELDSLLSGASSYYYPKSSRVACHLDLIPYATITKWAELTPRQRTELLAFAGDTLGLLLRDSFVSVLILNGQAVINNLQTISGVEFRKEQMPTWDLPRKSGQCVGGFSYKGLIKQVSGIELNREILVLGFNHNIQSSFGVTKQIKNEIRCWIAESIPEVIF